MTGESALNGGLGTGGDYERSDADQLRAAARAIRPEMDGTAPVCDAVEPPDGNICSRWQMSAYHHFPPTRSRA